MKSTGNISVGRILRILCGMALALSVSVSCEFRPLEDPGYRSRLNVNIRFADIKNVTCDVYNDKIDLPVMDPEVCHVVFYKEDENTKESKYVTEVFLTRKNVEPDGSTTIYGDVHIAPGDYKMLIWNFGTEITTIRNYQSWDLCEAYAPKVSDYIMKSYKRALAAAKAEEERKKAEEALSVQDDVLDDDTKADDTKFEDDDTKADDTKFEDDDTKVDDTKAEYDENVIYAPNHLFVARNEKESIPYHSGDYTIYAEAKTVVDSYYLQIKMQGLQYVTSAQAFLSGMSGSNFISADKRVEDPVSTVYFNLQKSDDKGVDVICTVFNTFGKIPEAPGMLRVTFDIATVDGRKEQRTFDITDLFNTKECIEHHWLLLEETIVIDPPDNPGGGGGGFDPEIGDWEDENHEIEL